MQAVAEAKAAPKPTPERPAHRRLRHVLTRDAKENTSWPRKHHLSRGDQRSARAGDGPRPARHRDGRGQRRRRGRARRGRRLGRRARRHQGSVRQFPGRVLDTPISESAFIGAAIGAATRGHATRRGAHVHRLHGRLLRPDLQPGRQVPVHVRRQGVTPVVIRTMYGAGLRAAAQHSQALYPRLHPHPRAESRAPVQRRTTPRAC